MEQTTTSVARETTITVQPAATLSSGPYTPYRTLLCCTKYKDRSNFQNVLLDLELSKVEKDIIRIRFLSIVENFQRRSRNYSYIFFTGNFIITVGSLFVPALLSIQNSDKNFLFTGDAFSAQIYWSTFVISLLVTIFNGILTLFKVNKKYYFLNTVLERLRSEGWQYFSLTGRYDGRLLKNEKPTHKNQFVHFTHYVEKIKMKQVEEEYYKADEKIGQLQGASEPKPPSQNGAPQELFPPSIDQPLNNMTGSEPEAVRRAVDFLSRQTVEGGDRGNNVRVIPENQTITGDEDNDSRQGREEGEQYDPSRRPPIVI
jgi:hypothetical protein